MKSRNKDTRLSGTIKKSEVIRMFNEIQDLCIRRISIEHLIDYDIHSWTYQRVALYEIALAKTRLISSKIMRLYVLKLLFKIYSTADDMLPHSEKLRFETEFNSIIGNYAFDTHMLITGSDRTTFQAALIDSDIQLLPIKFGETEMSWGNGFTKSKTKKYPNKDVN